jgi:hypothetical protein
MWRYLSVALPIARLLNRLVGSREGGPRHRDVFAGRLGRRVASNRLIPGVEALEARRLLAVDISLAGSTLLIAEVTPGTGQITVAFSNGKVIDPMDPAQSTIVQGVTVNAITQFGSPIASGTFLPFLNPYTSAQVTGVIVQQSDATSSVQVNDQIGFVQTVSGGATWTTLYNTADLGQQQLKIQNTPSILTVSSQAKVEVGSAFTANNGEVTIQTSEIVVGSGGAGGALTGNKVTLDTATNGKGAITFSGNLTANNTLKVQTNAVLDISTAVKANQTQLTLNAGGTQSGGSLVAIGVLPTFKLVAGDNVSFGLTANNIGEIASISAIGKSVTLGTAGDVTQSGPIVAASFRLSSSGGSVTLANSNNDVDALGISALGAVTFVDVDDVSLGVNGLGVTAVGQPVTVTTRGNLTQSSDGRVVASTFSVNILAPLFGNANLNLNSPDNQILAFTAINNSAAGAIAIVNTPVGSPLTITPAGVTALNGAVTIDNRTGIIIAGPINAGSPANPSATISLSSIGAITSTSQLTAFSLDVVNKGSTGDISLNAVTNNVAKVSIANTSTGVSNGIGFKGSSAGAGSLTIVGNGVTAALGDISIDTDGRKLVINGPITTVNGDVTLTAAGGVTQSAAAAIQGDGLKVTNTGGGAVSLTAPANDVATLEIANSGAAAAVSYADVNDLTLAPGAGVSANGQVSLAIGSSFTANAGSPITTTGGSVSITTKTGGITLAGGVTSTTGVSVSAGTQSAAGLVIKSAIDGGTGGVSLTATAALSSDAAGTVIGTDGVTISGATSVSLGASVESTGAGVTVTSSKGPVTTTAAAPLTAGGGAVTVSALGSATFGGAVTATGVIDVTAGDATTQSNVVVKAPFVAGNNLQISATKSITTDASLTGATVTTSSGLDTTIGAPVTGTSGEVTFTVGGVFTSLLGANVTAAGPLTVTGIGSMSVSGGLAGPQVTLVAGNATNAASIAIKGAVVATAGDASITASGGNLITSAAGTVSAAGGTTTLSGTTGVTVQTAISGDNVVITSSAGTVSLSDGSKVTTVVDGGVTFTAVNGIIQSAKSQQITAGSIVATNSTTGGITLANGKNAVSNFRADNTAPGGEVKFVNTIDLTISSPGITTSNGLVDIANGGAITLSGGINAGTASVDLGAAGNIKQAGSAVIAANSLAVTTTAGDVTLGAANLVSFLTGSNKSAGGKFTFVDADGLSAKVTTNDGDITITSGKLGVGPLAVGGINAGAANITLSANGGISGGAVQTTAGTVTLKNGGSGDIVLLSNDNSFPNVSAVSAGTINIKNSSFLGTNIVGPDGLSGGVIRLDSSASITQTKRVTSTDATFITLGELNLPLPDNAVGNLAVDALLDITFTNLGSLAVGVGGQGVVSGSGIGQIALTSLLGGITLNSKVSTSNTLPNTLLAPSTSTKLIALGSITQSSSAANIISGDLALISSAGDIVLPQGTNKIANLRANAAGIITYTDFNAFEVGFDSEPPLLPKLVGVDAGGPLTLTAGPTLTPGSPTGLLRVTEGLSWVGSVTLSAGLNSRVGFVDFVVTNQGDAPPALPAFIGDLRHMIIYGNSNAATQTINGATRVQPMRVVFDEYLDYIGTPFEGVYEVLDVQPTAPLPTINQPLDFNGTLSFDGRVGVDGTTILSTATVNGLVYNPGSNESRFEGMAVYGFSTGAGLQLRSATNLVQNSYFGVERDGLTLSSNKIGVEMLGQTSTSNLIGSLIVNEAAANVIGGNTVAGIYLRNGATANSVMGNFIGTDATLLNKLGNLGDGVLVNDANGNTVGNRNAIRPDGSAAASNAIAYNNGTGIRVTNSRAAAEGLANIIENNLVDANGVDGIAIQRSRFQVVGGSTLQQANVVTSQVTGNGVNVTGSFDTRITGNFIGVDDTGTGGLGNAAAGVLVAGSQRTVINQGNAISGNTTGVFINAGSTQTRVEGNFIGTDKLGSPVGNKADGVLIDRSLENLVQLGNVVANNGRHGVSITDSTASSINRGNIIAGNTISANGFAALGAGVNIEGGALHTIGGAGLGNVITSNANEGIRVVRSSRTGSSTGIRIQGNFVGTDANSEIDPTLGNTVGIRLVESTNSLVDRTNVISNNSQQGIRLEATTGATIGSATVDQGNGITFNGGAGVLITDKISTAAPGTRGRNDGTNLFGNLIRDNGGAGVVVEGGTFPNGAPRTTNVSVGTTPSGSGRGNTIVDNGPAGVGAPGIVVDGAQGVSFGGTTIYRTDGLLNPPASVQFLNGANGGAVAPRLQSAVVLQPSLATSQLRVNGTFATTASGTVTVQNGVATFSVSQTGLVVPGAVVVINGTGYRVLSVAGSGLSASLEGITTLLTAGNGRVSATNGTATFSVSQTGFLTVGSSIVVAGRTYQLTSLSSNGRTGTLSGAPSFAVSEFQIPGSAGFSVVPANVVNQQYVVNVYLNEYWDGNPSTGTGYGMRRFLGTISVTVGPNGTGTFSGTVAVPAGVNALGQFVTVTASPVRAIDGLTVPATSMVSTPVQATLNSP